jgi:hypothetical protein
MTAFEEWNAKQNNEYTWSGDVGEIRHRIEERRNAWKAALEWLVDNYFCCGDTAAKCPSCEISDAIKAELES